MHLLPTFLAFLAGLSTTLALALATTPPPDLLARADPPDPKLRITLKCGVCILQCSAITVACGFACGPGEIFGPIGCMNCLIIAGASQQCVQCVDKCERTHGHAALLDDCSQATNPCTGTPRSLGPGIQLVPQGLCTIPQYAKKVDNAGGQCSGKTSACDLSVSATKDCKPGFKVVGARDMAAAAAVPAAVPDAGQRDPRLGHGP